jgi:hypothetical protein
MRTLLAGAAAAEVATGLVLFAVPKVVVQLLLGAEVAGVGIATCRVAGIALIGLGMACWPGSGRQAYYGMLSYGTLVAAYLAYQGVRNEAGGPLLWPVVLLHAIIGVLLVVEWSRESTKGVGGVGG